MIRSAEQQVMVLQGRRVACAHCKGRYTYLARETHKVSSSGVVLLASDEKLTDAMNRAARKFVLKQDRRARWGAGMCPHCRRWQGWMVRSSRLLPSFAWGFGCLLLGLCFSGIFHRHFPEGAAGTATVILCWAGAAALGVWIAFLRGLPSGVAKAGRVDEFSIHDDDARGLLLHARAVDGNPLVEWYLHVLEKPPNDEVLIPAGFRDLTGEKFFPEEQTAERVLAEE
ncbi:MAG TPA: hypothetical protein VFS92_02540 [Planctomycetota bacterium]|nr:hypothetical protein [Planctomycetota bacterium]